MKTPKLYSRSSSIDLDRATRDVVSIVDFLRNGQPSEVVSFLRPDRAGLSTLMAINNAIDEHRKDKNKGIEPIPLIGQVSWSGLRQAIISASRIYEHRSVNAQSARMAIDSFIVQLVHLSSPDTSETLRRIVDDKSADIAKELRARIVELTSLLSPPAQ